MAALLLAQAAESASNDVYLLAGFILLAVALVLVFVELVLPSGGLISVLAAIGAVASIVAFFRYSTTAGLVAASSYVILGPILIALIFRVWIRSPLGRRMILGGSEEEVFDSDSEATARAEHERRQRLERSKQLVGAEGVTITALRPVGMVKINSERLDALAESGVIGANVPIVVVDVYDNQIKVRPKDR